MLFAAFQATRNLSSKVKDKVMETFKSLVNASLPPALRHCVHSFVDRSPLPSRETLRQAELTMDVGMLLQGRRERVFDGAFTYLWWDSTPHGFDWLLSQALLIRREDTLATFRAFGVVMSDAGALVKSDHSCYATPSDTIEVHTFLPVALGLRRSSLTHNVSALSYALFLEVGIVDGLTQFSRQ